MAEVFTYDEKARVASIELDNGRKFRLSNISRERAEQFLERYKAEQAAMAARREPGDPLSFTGPSGLVSRRGAA